MLRIGRWQRAHHCGTLTHTSATGSDHLSTVLELSLARRGHIVDHALDGSGCMEKHVVSQVFTARTCEELIHTSRHVAIESCRKLARVPLYHPCDP